MWSGLEIFLGDLLSSLAYLCPDPAALGLSDAGNGSGALKAGRPEIETAWATKDYFLNIWNVIWLYLLRFFGIPYGM